MRILSPQFATRGTRPGRLNAIEDPAQSGVLAEAGAVNYHINKPCDSECTFCFATFRDVRGQLSLRDGLAVISALHAHGARKINFAGGEPTLHKGLAAYIRHAKSLGLVTSIVTNGFLLPKLLLEAGDALDWVGLSADSADETTQAALGRGQGKHIARTIILAERCRALGIRLKLNSVVTALTVEEDMSAFVRAVAPERWKIFQVLRVVGQNDGDVEPLLIEETAFKRFVARHRHLEAEGITVVPEDNDAMTESYVMVDPMGRFFANSDGRDHRSEPILEVGLVTALGSVGFDVDKLIERGGHYPW